MCNTDQNEHPEPGNDESLCLVCREVDVKGLLTDPVAEKTKIFLGTLKEVLFRSSSCSLCFLAFKVIDATSCDSNGNIPLDFETTSCYLGTDVRWTNFWTERELSAGQIDNVVRAGSNGTPATFTGHNTREIVVYTVPRFDRANFPVHRSIAQVCGDSCPRIEQQFKERQLLPTGVDFSLVNHWRTLCRDLHGEKCSKPQWLHVQTPTSLRLIDVEINAVVKAQPQWQYTALSYVWGTGHSQHRLDESNIPLSSEDRFPLPTLPKTINDAMKVTAELGIRYLWVDALCIAQNPTINLDKAHQLEQMDRIYKNAEVVIIAAACEHSDDDIPGVNARQAEQFIRTVHGLKLAVSLPTHEHSVQESVYNQRAWTYQEQMFARKALVFGKEQAYWLCQCDLWCESVFLEPAVAGTEGFVARILPDTSKPPSRCMELLSYDLHDQFIADENDVFSAYSNIVLRFTTRRLGYPSDGLNAISGILKLLQYFDQQHWMRLRFGLSEELFDVCLLWVPLSTCSRPTNWASGHKLPSWSWAGWFSGEGHGFLYDYLNVGGSQSGLINVVPAITWFAVSREGLAVPITTNTTPFSGQKQREDISIPGVESQLDPNRPPELSPGVPKPHLDGEYLQFLTTTVTVFLGQRLPWEIMAYYEPQVVWPYQLSDKNGRFVATMMMSEDLAHRAKEAPMQLIFLSFARDFGLMFSDARKARWIENALEDSTSWTDYEILNVMWIVKDVHGIAERVMIGKALEAMWLKSRPKTEWIVLG